MVFIETPVFTRQIATLIDDETYARLQDDLARNPEGGDVIPGTGSERFALLQKAAASAGVPVWSISISSAMHESRCCSPTQKTQKTISAARRRRS
jgi:hypothetical protein